MALFCTFTKYKTAHNHLRKKVEAVEEAVVQSSFRDFEVTWVGEEGEEEEEEERVFH